MATTATRQRVGEVRLDGEDEQTGESQEGWVKARGGSMPDRAESGRGEGVI
jgi:hypothetical protein